MTLNLVIEHTKKKISLNEANQEKIEIKKRKEIVWSTIESCNNSMSNFSFGSMHFALPFQLSH